MATVEEVKAEVNKLEVSPSKTAADSKIPGPQSGSGEGGFKKSKKKSGSEY